MFDIERPDELLAYLRSTGRIEPFETPQITVLAGGVSNRTVLVARESGEAWVMKQALAKLRVAVDWFSAPERIEREALGLKYLAELAPDGMTTPLVFQDSDKYLLAMSAVPQPHENWKTMLLAGRLESDHVLQFAQLLATIHIRAAARRDQLANEFADRSFFESLRIEPYYAYAASQVTEASDFLRDLITQTRLRQVTLVHGDFSPKNILIREGRLILLDHEVIHWGDPAFDVGFALTHFLSKAHHLPHQREAFAAAALLFWTAYRARLDSSDIARDLDQMSVRHTLGCLLARVAGRSPLEYLIHQARARQRAVAVKLMQKPIARPPELIDQFVGSLNSGQAL